MPAEGQEPTQDMITSVPGVEPSVPNPNVPRAGVNMPLNPDSPAASAFQIRAQRAADSGSVVMPEYVMPEGDLTVPELPAVGTPDRVLDGPRETGSYTRPDGVTIDSQIVGGAKETRIHGMGSQHDLPETAAEHAARMQASQADRPLITEVPLTDEQREAFAAKRAADEAARAAEPIKHGGYNGFRMSQVPGAVDALGRPTGPIIRPPEAPEN